MVKAQRITLGIAKVDSRRRVSLARFVGELAEGDQFILAQDDEGVIYLTPAETVSKRELAVISDPKTLKRIKEGIDDAGRGDVSEYDPTKAIKDLKRKQQGK